MNAPVPAEPSSITELCRHMERLIAAAGHGVSRIRVYAGDAGVDVEWSDAPPSDPHAGPAASSAAVAGSAAGGANGHGTDAGVHVVRAPMVGTFYRAPVPGAPPFVREGDIVESGQQVAIVEAMKLMNPIEADRSGVVTAVLVTDAESVEYDQPLMEVRVEGGEGS